MVNPIVKLDGMDGESYIIDLEEVVFIKASPLVESGEGWIFLTTIDGVGQDVRVAKDDLNTIFEDLYAKLRKIKEEKNQLLATLNTI